MLGAAVAFSTAHFSIRTNSLPELTRGQALGAAEICYWISIDAFRLAYANRNRVLCQNCVRYPLKRRSNTVIYGDTQMHTVVTESRRWELR
jgi:hypothetical protein